MWHVSVVALCVLVAQWLWHWTCDWRSRVQSQPLHCRVRPCRSRLHTFASATKQYHAKDSEISATTWAKVARDGLVFYCLCVIVGQGIPTLFWPDTLLPVLVDRWHPNRSWSKFKSYFDSTPFFTFLCNTSQKRVWHPRICVWHPWCFTNLKTCLFRLSFPGFL